MTTNAKIKQSNQEFTPGELVTLYELDMTDLGGTTMYFTDTTLSGASVVFNGVTYVPIDVETDGWEYDGKQLPRPKIRIANTNKVLMAEIYAYGDLLGAVLTRRRTYTKYLDGQPDADPNAQFPVDVYVVEQKTLQNKFMVEWELSAYMDYTGTKIPKGRLLRDTCTHIYRKWTGSVFDYTKATCPYTGTNYFKKDGTVTTAANDSCGRKYSDCKLRYPNKDDELPTKAFPSIARTRV